MADQHAVNLLRLAVRKFIDIGVTVRAPQISMGTVYIQVLSYIQELKFSLLVMIAEPAVLVTEQAVFLVKSNSRCTCKREALLSLPAMTMLDSMIVDFCLYCTRYSPSMHSSFTVQ